MSSAILVATFGTDAWRIRGDATAAHIRAILAYDAVTPQVYSYHDPGGTLAQARNHAARAVTADWLFFVDADDEIEAGYVTAMNRAYFEGAATLEWAPLLVPSVRYVHADPIAPGVQIRGRAEEPRIPQEGQWPRLNECVIGTGIRRDLFLRLGGFRELPSLEDYDLWLRAYDAGSRLVYVRDAVYRANVNPEGRNRDQSPYDGIWRDHLERIAA